MENEKVPDGAPDNKSLNAEELYEELRKTRAEAKERRLETNELKAKLQAIEEEKAKEQGRFKELAEQKTKEAEELKKLADELSVYKEKYTAVEIAKRQDLLNKLDEDERAHWENVPLDLLEAHTKSIEKYKVPPTSHDGKRSSGKPMIDLNKGWKQYSTAELEILKRDHPEVYQEKFNKFYNRR